MLRHLLNISDLTKQDIEYILSVASNIASNPSNFGEVAKGKILATLFFEPSTRTRLSFESAMLRLGGQVIGFADANCTSSAKGETVEDTARIVSCYCDVIATRHPKEFAPHNMAKTSIVPVINAGDGSNEHPTQTLADIVTIKNKFGRLSGLNIGLCGDLKYGRTVHSLVKVLSLYKDNKFFLISPKELSLPKQYLEILEKEKIPYIITEDLQGSINELDVLYMTRVQEERFEDKALYQRLKGFYILDADKLKTAKEELAILHPLPRVGEIDPAIDSDPRALYFTQAQCGVYARMALIIIMLGLADKVKEGIFSVHTATEYPSDRLQQGA